MELFQEFPDNETAMQWFVEARWPDGIRCAYCESENVKVGAKHRSKRSALSMQLAAFPAPWLATSARQSRARRRSP